MDRIEASNAAYALHCEASELRAAGKNEEAAGKWAACVEAVPDEPVYLREYADCLARLQRWEFDLHYASLAAALEPGNAEAWALMGAACGHLGRQEEAKRYYDRADALAPNSPSVLWNRSLYYLLHGDYERGWRDYEWRFLTSQRRRTLKPMWDGTPIPGRTLFVWAEQGLGDTIHFARFLRRAKERSGARIVFEVQRDLVGLMHGSRKRTHGGPLARNTGGTGPRNHGSFEIDADEIVAQATGGSIALDDFEHVSLMSLPYVLGIHQESEFWDGAYIGAEAAELPEPKPGGFKVGVCWQGSTNNGCDSVRSIAQEEFWDQVIGGRVEVNWYGISPAVQLPDSPNCVNPSLVSFVDTARAIGGLDLVITVDTSVAHLAGAMGKAVWILLRYATDWRWCLRHESMSPWYPSARLFRQGSYGEGWGEVLRQVDVALSEMAGKEKG